jgi:O-antigen ligase
MTIASTKGKILLEEVGFWSLLLTLFTISFPRSWSLYPLGIFLAAGAALWVIDFRNVYYNFRKIWFLVLPPVLYFLVHVVSAAVQASQISILEDRLMFLLIPLLGFPVFFGDYSKSRLSVLFSGFTIGIVLMSIFLIARILYNIYNNYPGNIPLFQWLTEHQQEYLSIGFSVFEHPTYLALKINWVLILLIFFDQVQSFITKYSIPIIILLTIILFLLASKAGLLIWFILILIFFIKKIRRARNPIFYILLIPLFILFAVSSVMEIQRIEKFITTVRSDLSSTQIDWKNIDQRTREWYSSTQIIKENPVFGTGLLKAQDMMVEEFLRNGFKDEADLKLNAHNQFLEAQMTFGIAGTLSLLCMLLVPLVFRKRLKYQDLTASFISLISFYLLFESLFNRQWGIMFFLLFYCILIISSRNIQSQKLGES